MKAEIITIGDEILIGQIIDTNSAWIAETFNLSGIEIYQITSVHDDHDHIMKALEEAEINADLVILTGGLGPTKDDITKHCLCEYFNANLVFHEPSFKHIWERFKNRGIDLNKMNKEQAMVPDTCQVLFNKPGTAPGMWFEQNDTIFVSVPGVPFEMKYLVEYEIIPRLIETGRTRSIYHRTVLTQGLPESMLADKLEAFENNLPSHIKLAYLPNPMAVRLRLSGIGDDQASLRQDVEKEVRMLEEIIPDHIYGYDDETLGGAVGKLLLGRSKTLAVAESCSGGYISHLLTSVAGSSGYFKGAVTAYSNEVKSQVLGVNHTVIEEKGAVSKEVAQEMALGVKRLTNADYGVSTTGIAGPTGGSEDKPVGTVWIAVAGKNELIAKKYTFGNNRERNIIRTSNSALQLIRQIILKDL